MIPNLNPVAYTHTNPKEHIHPTLKAGSPIYTDALRLMAD
jgi:hypothetical protein